MKRELVVTLSVLFLPNVARASDYVVAPGGDDGASGDMAAPFLTIQHAVDVAVAGDTITVREGTYAEGVHFQQSGAPGQPIVLRAYPGERPIVEPPEGQFPMLIEAEPWQNKLEIGSITVEGFELRNATTGAVFEITNAHDLVIKNNYLHDGLGQGLLGMGHDIVIDGNEIARCGDPSTNLTHGVYLTGRRFTIINNVVHSNASFGIQVAAYACGGVCAGLDYSGTVDWLIANNVFAFQQNRSGIVVWQPGERYGDNALGEMGNIRILNNIFLDNNGDNPGQTNGIDFWSVVDVDVSTIEIANNMFWSVYGGKDLGSSEDNAGIGADTANLSDNVHADPLLVDPANGDYRLKMGSPAIDSGVDVVECPHDLEGNSRPAGAHWDMGAYELGSRMGGASSSSGQGGSGPSTGVGAGSTTEASAGPGEQAATPDERADESSGCGCSIPGAPRGHLALVGLALVAALAERRSARRRSRDQGR